MRSPRRYLIGMVTVGLVVGWVMGYYGGTTWWSVLLLLCVIFASAFVLWWKEARRAKQPNPKKAKK